MFIPKKAKLLMGAASTAPDVSEVFSTDLYTGNGSSQTITNGVDLAGEGGLVWVKQRSGTQFHSLHDSGRGFYGTLSSNSTAAEDTGPYGVSGFNSDGFAIDNAGSYVNNSGSTYAAWTFRKSPRFFDVVTYTGDGAAGRTISHNLGVEPGMIVVKRRDTTGEWWVWHRGKSGFRGMLDSTQAFDSDSSGTIWGDGATHTAPDSSDFTVSSYSGVNASGGTYVAYLFAHDDADDGIIQCGSYTGNGSATGPTITLGWEPQYVMIKRTDLAEEWQVWDNARDTSSPHDAVLYPNRNWNENFESSRPVAFNSTGFQPQTDRGAVNASGGTYIFTAIRAEGV